MDGGTVAQCQSTYCDCCRCKKPCEEFQVLLELKGGLVIYRHAAPEHCDENQISTNNLPKPIESHAGATGAMPRNKRDDENKTPIEDKSVIIIHNTNNADILSADCLPEFDINKVSCPRCRHIMARARQLLESIAVVDKNDIRSVCDYCKLKQKSRAPCHICENVIKKFEAIKAKEETKNRLISFVATAKQLLETKTEIEQKRKTRAYSDIDIENLFRGKKSIYRSLRSERYSLFKLKSSLASDTKLPYLSDTAKKVTKQDKIICEVPELISTQEMYHKEDMDTLSKEEKDLKEKAVKIQKSCIIIEEKGISLKKTSLSTLDKITVPLKPILKSGLEQETDEQKIQSADHVKKSHHHYEDLVETTKRETVLEIGTIGIIQRSHSEESLPTSLSDITEKIFKKHFEYYFPGISKKDEQLMKTSAELVNEIKDRIRLNAEEIIKRKKENKEKKLLQREKIKLAAKEAKLKKDRARHHGIMRSDEFHADENISSDIDIKTGKLIKRKKQPRVFKSSVIKEKKDSTRKHVVEDYSDSQVSKEAGIRAGQEIGKKNKQDRRDKSKKDREERKGEEDHIREKKEKTVKYEKERDTKIGKSKGEVTKKEKGEKMGMGKADVLTKQKKEKDKIVKDMGDETTKDRKEKTGKGTADTMVKEKKDKIGKGMGDAIIKEKKEKIGKNMEGVKTKEKEEKIVTGKGDAIIKEKKEKTGKTMEGVKTKEKEDKKDTGKGDSIIKEKKEKIGKTMEGVKTKEKEDKKDTGKGDAIIKEKKEQVDQNMEGVKTKEKDDKIVTGKGDAIIKEKKEKEGEVIEGATSREKKEKKSTETGDALSKEKESKRELNPITKKNVEEPRKEEDAIDYEKLQKSREEKYNEVNALKDSEVGGQINQKERNKMQVDGAAETSKSVVIKEKQKEDKNVGKAEDTKAQPDLSKDKLDETKKKTQEKNPSEKKKEQDVGKNVQQKDTSRGSEAKKEPKKEGKKGKSTTETENLKGVSKKEVDMLNNVLMKNEKNKTEEQKVKMAQDAELALLKEKADKKTSKMKEDSLTFDDIRSKRKQRLETKQENEIPVKEVDAKNVKKAPAAEVDFKNVKMARETDDVILKMIKMKPTEQVRQEKKKQLSIKEPEVKHHVRLLPKARPKPSSAFNIESELDLDAESLLQMQIDLKHVEKKESLLIYGTKITKKRNVPPAPAPQVQPALSETVFKKEEHPLPTADVAKEHETTVKSYEFDTPQGVFRYALSDRTYIENGWTLLPTEKIVRRIKVYRMHPSKPQFDWFQHNKPKGIMHYDSGEELAKFKDNGRGHWYYKNGRLALDYYDSEDANAQQRYIIYSSGEPDERGRSSPITVLGMFDYSGNGVVFDHHGKIRLKYNQTEGVVLDRGIGPVSHWKWHSLNDPPELQQVMIDTQLNYKEPEILALPTSDDHKKRTEDEAMVAIEYENFLKAKSFKPQQQFQPYQIRMKAMKINEQFSLKIIDQQQIYLNFRDGLTTIKLNLGMTLDCNEIVETSTAEVGVVGLNMEKFPPSTESIANLQMNLNNAKRVEHERKRQDRKINPEIATSSADKLLAASSKPLRPPLLTVNRIPYANNVYYNTRLI